MTKNIELLEFGIFFFESDSGFEMLDPDMKNPNPEMAIWTKHLIKTASMNGKLQSLIKIPLHPYTKPEIIANMWPEYDFIIFNMMMMFCCWYL